MKKNIAILLIVTMLVSVLSACQKSNQVDKEEGTSDIITEAPMDENEDTKTEDTNLSENETSDAEDVTSDDQKPEEEDTSSSDDSETGKHENETATDGKDSTNGNDITPAAGNNTDKQESTTTTTGKDTGKKENTSTTGKDTGKKDNTTTSGKDTSKKDNTTTTGGKDSNKQDNSTSTGGKDTGKQDDKKPSGDKDSNSEASKEEDKAPSGLSDDLTTIIDKIYGIKDPGIRLLSNSLDLSNMDMVSYNTGLKDVSKVKEIVVSEAMIISQAYSLVLVRTKDAADAKSVAEEMLEGINPNKWICVGADKVEIATYQDVVMLIMADSQLSDLVTSDEIVDAFKEICGGKLDLELEK